MCERRGLDKLSTENLIWKKKVRPAYQKKKTRKNVNTYLLRLDGHNLS